MLKWQNEFSFTRRYAAAGVLNSLVGIITIWGLSILGLSPFVANFLGYAVGLCIGFLTAKKFVFRSGGHVTSEAIRYFFSFIFSYGLNLTVLYLFISAGSIDIMIAQGFSVFAYVIAMYVSSRLFVFQGHVTGSNKDR